MKHWLYVSVVRGRMTEYYLIPCSKRSDVLTTVDSFSGSIVDANVIYSDEIVECFDSNIELDLSEVLTDEPTSGCRFYAPTELGSLEGKNMNTTLGEMSMSICLMTVRAKCESRSPPLFGRVVLRKPELHLPIAERR